jgi:hypothetical protein
MADAAVVPPNRHIDGDGAPPHHQALIQVRDGGLAGGEDPTLVLKMQASRQRHARRPRGVHDLLAILPQQEDAGSRELPRDHRFGLGAEAGDVALCQRRR